ncbi:two-component system chemotaxis response regulator CheY [Geothermobacter ehrlichii]|uniref:Two-component system chemotaxis response regulator CheY n=1 Tax=Geothermobacter ehrlichii TaxID=213224 RepID=A0A5D3WLP0_9BACT|nr:response regulator [Geothermobacter ehrlichii]TYO98149.1 two-component system chemotaxis response regulator CheY [Geothermobacter ehrlichii]
MPYRILIVDDALFMRNMLRDIFSRQNDFEVVGEAANGVEAVECYRELQPDLVTMDIVMPLKSGIEALQEIVALDGDARVIMCSALGQESLIVEAVSAGALDFIVKPFQESRVLEVARRVFSRQ